MKNLNFNPKTIIFCLISYDIGLYTSEFVFYLSKAISGNGATYLEGSILAIFVLGILSVLLVLTLIINKKSIWLYFVLFFAFLVTFILMSNFSVSFG